MDEEIQVFVPECADDDVSELLRNLTKCLSELQPDSISHGFLGGEFGCGCAFETPIFKMFPYYWGDCTCGYHEREIAWSETHKHTAECYQAAYQAIPHDWHKDHDGHSRVAKGLCELHGIPWDDGRGSAVHCTCGHQDEYMAWVKVNGHSAVCPLEIPNFLHKPSGATVEWYKYIGRDMRITAPEGFDWEAAIHECLCSARDASEKQK